MKKIFLPKNIHGHRGFTLIETLFAILIFTASLVMLISVSARGITATSGARDELVARYLAVAGLEVVRNVRDSNFITPGSRWLQGIENICDPECHMVTADGASPGLQSGGNAPLYLNESSSGYTTTDSGLGVITRFSQTITVETTDQEDEVLVTSRIDWKGTNNRERSISYSNYLERWR